MNKCFDTKIIWVIKLQKTTNYEVAVQMYQTKTMYIKEKFMFHLRTARK